MLQFTTTIFTCFVLAVAFLVFSRDTEVIVIRPIKKVVEIIHKLADDPLKKPEPPVEQDENTSQMKTKMLELTIFKISTFLQRGFGEIGAKIVAKTLTQEGSGINLNVAGRRVEAVMSIARIS